MTILMKTILDLCGGTGAWSKPYVDAGYKVINVTLPKHDVRNFTWPEQVYGILAAPPCDHFAGSGAQYWKQKDADGRTEEALEIVDSCLKIIRKSNPIFWVLENPVGRLPKLRPELGRPKLIFNPCDYGDPWIKRTCLWGNFNIPTENPVTSQRACKAGSWIMKFGGKSERTKMLRSITPPGFARAFFEANR